MRKILTFLLFLTLLVSCGDRGSPTSPTTSSVLVKDIEILKPTAGESLTIYSDYTFQWRVSESLKDKIDHFDLFLSRDGGNTYIPMENNGEYSTNLPSTARSWTWKVVPPITTGAQVKIIGVVSSTESYGDVSWPFNIERPQEAYCILWGEINVTEDYFGDIKFLGEIKNIGAQTAYFVKITFTTYDSSGLVIGVDYTYTSPMDLETDQIGAFECWTNVKKSKVASWKYNIEWSTW